MRARIIVFVCLLLTVFFVGCARQPTTPQTTPDTTQDRTPDTTPGKTPGTTPPETTPDVTTTASIVDDAEAFEKAISDNGTWIICLTKDLSIDKELVLDGEYTNGKKDDQGKDIIQRKIALYTQDSERNITNRFTLTVPKLTINSPMASIQHGTFKGDLYVSAENFQLVDTTVEGNVFFTNKEAQSTFKMDEKSKITGKQELKE